MRRGPVLHLGVALPLLAALAAGACGVRSPVDRHSAADRACRAAVSLVAGQDAPTIDWLSPPAAAERAILERWCDAVGPAVVGGAAARGDAPMNGLAIVSWNLHVGSGDLRAVVRELRTGRYSAGRPVDDFVLLVQEAYRADPRVPSIPSGAAVAAAITPAPDGRPLTDVVVAARELGLACYYVPSMRNGDAAEDRGNAILSTFPLERLLAVELPFERQRRVAVSASIRGRSPSGHTWELWLVNTHLDNLAGAKHAWLLTGPARARQVAALLGALPKDHPVVLGGDLNTWFGAWDPAYRALAARFPQRHATDERATFLGLLRLDHPFLDLPEGWHAHVDRLDSRFGSDHYPLVAWIDADLREKAPPPRRGQ